MDWARDNAFLSESRPDLRRVFKYAERAATIVTILERDNYTALACTLETEKEWERWLDQIESMGRGMFLILSNRDPVTPRFGPSSEMRTDDDWPLEREDIELYTPAMRRAETFAALSERATKACRECKETSSQSPASLRCLPFSEATFQRICKRFSVHRSIIRTLARADVPTFSCDSVNMNGPAFVYSCRTSKSWPSDLAISATYYPQKGLNFAIVYGTNSSTEKEILTRLSWTRKGATHPLVLAGIIAELELQRHIRLVESNINNVEAKIFELNFHSGKNVRHVDREEAERRNEAKRTAWLDLSYLRSSVTTWSAQLQKISDHAQHLNETVFALQLQDYAHPESVPAGLLTDASRQEQSSKQECELEVDEFQYVDMESELESTFEDNKGCKDNPKDDWLGHSCKKSPITPSNLRHDNESYMKEMRIIGEKIQDRISDMRDEYEEKIRDCTMRVDGMAMATQWAQSEIAVEIALASNRDSKVMRSISLVTMVFLPGTFFATVFSMQFFDWFGENDKSRVSKYLWVYVVVTVICTGITIGLWYFFVLFRRPCGKAQDIETSTVK